MTNPEHHPQPVPAASTRARLLYEAVDATRAWWRRRDAAAALGAYDDDEAATVLGRMLVKANDTSITDAAARGLLARGDEPGLTLVLAGLAVANPSHADYLMYSIHAVERSGASDVDGLLAAVDRAENRWAKAGAAQYRAWRDGAVAVAPEPAVGSYEWAVQTGEPHGPERKLATIPLLSASDDEAAAALGRLLLDPDRPVVAAATALATRDESSALTVALAAFALAGFAGATAIRRQVTSAGQAGAVDIEGMLPEILAGPDPWARQGARSLTDWLNPKVDPRAAGAPG